MSNIEYADVHYSYPNGTEVLKGVSFSIRSGEKVALLGLNGAGKSTLLLTSNGLLMPTSGKIRIGDMEMKEKTLPLIRQKVGMVFQNADDQLFMPTVKEDVAFGPMNMKLSREETDRRVKAALEEVGMEEFADRSPSHLSGGQKKMVAIATVLSMTPDILVLDEPSASLDWKAKTELYSILRKSSYSCLIATHDLILAREVCTRALILSEGVISADVEMAEVFSNRELMKLIGAGEIENL